MKSDLWCPLNDFGEKYRRELCQICNQYLCQEETVGFLPSFKTVFLLTQPCIIQLLSPELVLSSGNLDKSVQFSSVLCDASSAGRSPVGDGTLCDNCDVLCASSTSESSSKLSVFGFSLRSKAVL